MENNKFTILKLDFLSVMLLILAVFTFPNQCYSQTNISVKERISRSTNYLQQKQYDKVLSDMSEVIKMEPENKIAYYLRANCYVNMERLNEARNDLLSIIKLDWTDVDAWSNLGVLEHNSNNFKKASLYFSMATVLNPTNADIYENLGSTYMLLGDTVNAYDNYYIAACLNNKDGQSKEGYIMRMKPEVVFVEGGNFSMGTNLTESILSDAKPVHQVTVSNFQIGKTEVTVGQYRAFCLVTGRRMPFYHDGPLQGGENYPVHSVTYQDCLDYCKWLGDTYGGKWRLPTEAEWEFAARGGVKSKKYAFSGGNDISRYAWSNGNSENILHEVGSKLPNELGIYDMSGNLYEWCSDWYQNDYYKESPENNPQGPSFEVGYASDLQRIIRGGSYLTEPIHCRVDKRMHNYYKKPDYILGFRVILTQ